MVDLVWLEVEGEKEAVEWEEMEPMQCLQGLLVDCDLLFSPEN